MSLHIPRYGRMRLRRRRRVVNPRQFCPAMLFVAVDCEVDRSRRVICLDIKLHAANLRGRIRHRNSDQPLAPSGDRPSASQSLSQRKSRIARLRVVMDHPDTAADFCLKLGEPLENSAHFAVVVLVGTVPDVERIKNCKLGLERLHGFGQFVYLFRVVQHQLGRLPARVDVEIAFEQPRRMRLLAGEEMLDSPCRQPWIVLA
jgi:hypothetical protein